MLYNTPLVDPTYVQKLLYELRMQLESYHKKINEIEQIRHLEDPIALAAEEQPSGLRIRIGATNQLVENVKSALTTNIPTVKFKPLRDGTAAQENSSKREKFWRAYIADLIQTLNELADSQCSLGLGILKPVYYPWPKNERRRNKGESDTDYRNRQKGLKRLWGPPFKVLNVHPLTFYFRPGVGGQAGEIIEHAWKPRREIYAAYGLQSNSELVGRPKIEVPDTQAAATTGQPDETIRPAPAGTDLTTQAQVTEYWSPQAYQVYIDGGLVHEEKEPSLTYLITTGRTSASKDLDKFGVSVAEIFRHNEPTIDRTLTRMAEGVELLVKKRLTLESPEGATLEMDEGEGEDNQPQPRTYRFKPDVTEALPAGSKIVDPFAGVENVFGAMPFVELMLGVMGSHGVAPIFKGVPPGATGSGYRDNSLYMMAKSQFQYLLDNYEKCLADLVRWLEAQLVRRVSQEIWQDELSLSPKDIKDFPCQIVVEVEPLLPQNIIPEGQFYDRMHTQGHIPRRYVLEKGMREEQPDDLLKERMEEDIQEMLKPIIYQDVLRFVGILPPVAPSLVGPDGKPISSQGTNPFQQLIAGNGGGEVAQAAAGSARAGQPRQPPEMAGEFPPGQKG